MALVPRTPPSADQDAAKIDPEVRKWLDEHAIATGKSDINLVVTDGRSSRAPEV